MGEFEKPVKISAQDLRRPLVDVVRGRNPVMRSVDKGPSVARHPYMEDRRTNPPEITQLPK